MRLILLPLLIALAIPLLLWGSVLISFSLFTILFQDSSSLRKRKDSKNFPSVSVEIDMNPNFTFYQDVHKLLHFPEESKIAIYFNKQRSCVQPQLIGRLSGMALTTVTWEASHYISDEEDYVNGSLLSHQQDNNILLGYYHVPLPGTYFIEIIAIMCGVLLHDVNFAGNCLVEPDHHRLTRDGAFINALSSSTLLPKHYVISNDDDVRPAAGNFLSNDTIGYWWHDEYRKNGTALTPLYTRYQPQGCQKADDMGTDRCRLATNLSRFDYYQFKFASSTFHDGHLRSVLEGNTDKICVEGASHAVMLQKHMKSVLASLNASTTIDIDPRSKGDKKIIHYVSGVNETTINRIIERNCTKVIIGFGQWDAGWPGGHPTRFPEYELTLNTTIPLMLRMFTDANVQVYYRSTHYNPIGNKISSCPPKDWRSPPVIDMYNRITKRLCDRFGMTWINTNDIMGVMWDRARDWCHYDDVSSDMEARYLLGMIFAT